MNVQDYILNMKAYTNFKSKDKNTNEVARCMKEDDKTIFVFAKGKKNKGYRYNIESFLRLYEPIIVDSLAVEKSWHNRCKRVENKLKKSGLWPEFLEFVQNLQKMSLEDRKDIYNKYSGYSRLEPEQQRNTDYYKKYTKRYTFIFKGYNIDTNYIYELSNVQTKSMYFGKYENKRQKECIRQAIEKKEDLTIRTTVNYDVTFEYKADKNKAWYSEEYRGCGNGHYYIAIDENTALFIEND